MTASWPPTEAQTLRLQLFVTGATPRSRKAIAHLKAFCDAHLEQPYELEIVDLYRTPERARDAQIVVAPTLLRTRPEPRRLAIGDLSDATALKSLLMVA